MIITIPPPDAVLLDVRTPQEYREGHIPGSKNVPLQQLDKITSVAHNKETALFVYCYSGSFHTHRILFVNDPDHVCVRSKPAWAKSVLSLISLSGELYMLSDDLSAYTGERLDIIRKTLPPMQTCAGETGALSAEYPAYTWTKLHGFAVQSHETPVEMEDIQLEEALNIAGWAPDRENDHPFSTLWSFPMVHHGQNWRVMLRVATTPLQGASIALEKLALDPKKTYHAFDFWKQEYLGMVTGRFEGRALELGCCQAVAFHEADDRPAVIGSDRHISMDAVSILGHKSEEKRLVLQLSGIAGRKIGYTLWLPKGIWDVKAAGAKVHLYENGPIYKLDVAFDDTSADVEILSQD